MQNETAKKGRPPIKTGERSIAVSLRMTREQREKLAALGGAAWVRVKINEEGKK